MNLTQDNTVLLDNNNFRTALTAANSSGKNFILTEDITLPANWSPVGTATITPSYWYGGQYHPFDITDVDAFCGNFYGNGHTVSISGFLVPDGVDAFIGLLGVVNDALIRDLIVQYLDSVSVSRAGETLFGGVAGTTMGTAKLENVLVKGSVQVEATTDHNMYVGGIAGLMTNTSSVENTYGGLDLTVKHPTATTEYDSESFPLKSSIFVGGIVGKIYGYNTGYNVKVKEGTVIGKINVTAESCTIDFYIDPFGLIIGGVIGMAEYAELNDLHYNQGNISVDSKLGAASIGGVIGLTSNAKATKCSVLAKSLDIVKTSRDFLNVGGFVGQYGNGEIVNCYSEIPITVNALLACVGGFAGQCFADISYCYSKSDISVNSTWSNSTVGGLLGFSYNAIKYCYAISNVSSTGFSNRVGGLIGSNYAYDDSNPIIEDCYYIGNIFSDITLGNGYFYFGGIGGQCDVVQRSFSRGTITVQNNIISSNNNVGIVGSNSTISNSAALGASITVTSPGTKNIGRVVGAVSGETLSNNYAYNDMKLYQSNTYGAGGITPTTPTSTNAASKDGADAHDGMFRTQSFWKETLGFSDDHWIFTTVGNMRHPILRAADGSEMGGQR